jgi:D-glycero-D-manno-heptose 1,7-bisphosphate phosphatase
VVQSRRKAVFLDRDGTLVADHGYIRDPADVELLPGVLETLRAFKAAGRLLFVVSNQSGIARGMITATEAASVHERFVTLLSAGGVVLDKAYYCPHGPDDTCLCRKPLPGMLRQAAQEFAVDMPHSVMIGDKMSDVAAGFEAGCRTILFGALRPVDTSSRPDWVAGDWETIKKTVLTL